MVLVVTGKPGSGKGTQAKKLANKLGLHYFSTGDIAREWAKEDSKIEEIVNKKGQWIAEEQMTARVSRILTEKFDKPENIIFDGYPRFLSQYKFLQNWLEERGSGISAVILLKISDDEAIKRLSARRLDKKTGKIYNLLTEPPGPEIDEKTLVQRSDDKPEVIKSRIAEYKKHTQAMVDYVKIHGKLISIDAERSIGEIADELASKFDTNVDQN